tara:strand:+ start:54345 stop:55076 length:732 start_codon:yes stop_codon:yes gene_type:complete
MLVKKHLFLLYLLFYAPFCIADKEIPRFFEVNYTLYSNDMKVGLMERRFFQKDDGKYAFSSESKTTGFIALFKKVHVLEVSNWDLIESNFIPLHYTYNRTKGKKKRDVDINFNWQTKRIVNRVNDSTWHMQTQPGVLDKLLYQLTIMSDLKSGNVPKSYFIADGGKIKEYRFEYITDEIIKTPLGEFNTIKLARHKLNSKQETYLWCAYDLDFLPIKVINHEKDDRISTAIIKSINGLGPNTD